MDPIPTKTLHWQTPAGARRTVTWMEAGDPGGFPLIYAHGNPGCRLEIEFLHLSAKAHGFRLITMDRPGLGGSSLVQPYDLTRFAADTERLADELGLAGFALMGWSSGGPMVLAAAHALPERVRAVAVVASYTNFGDWPEGKELLDDFQLRGLVWLENRPTLANRVLSVVRWTDLELPNFYLKLARKEMAPSDRQQLQDDARADLFIRIQQEALHQGVEGAMLDLEMQWQPWPFSLREVEVPVQLFQGRADTFVPWPFAEHMVGALPRAQLTLADEYGHLMPMAPEVQRRMFRSLQPFCQ